MLYPTTPFRLDYIAKKDPLLNSLVIRFMGLKPPQFPSIFEALVNTISCQQISLDAGLQIQNRFIASFGLRLEEKGQVFYAFPRPNDMAQSTISSLKNIGYSTHKSETLIGLASAMMEDKYSFNQLKRKNNDEVVNFLCQFKGIGRWTAEYVLLRGLGKLEVFPGDDVGEKNNLYRLLHLKSKPDYNQVAEITAKWRPYAGLVYFHLLLQQLEKV